VVVVPEEGPFRAASGKVQDHAKACRDARKSEARGDMNE
jgi:hypothetical protein